MHAGAYPGGSGIETPLLIPIVDNDILKVKVLQVLKCMREIDPSHVKETSFTCSWVIN